MLSPINTASSKKEAPTSLPAGTVLLSEEGAGVDSTELSEDSWDSSSEDSSEDSSDDSTRETSDWLLSGTELSASSAGEPQPVVSDRMSRADKQKAKYFFINAFRLLLNRQSRIFKNRENLIPILVQYSMPFGERQGKGKDFPKPRGQKKGPAQIAAPFSLGENVIPSGSGQS